MLPFLQTVGGGQERSMDDVIELLAKVFKLSEQDRVELLPSGKQRTFYNRVGWARTYLKKAGLVETPGVGKVRITERGIDVLKKNPTKIDRKFLMQFPEFIEFQKHVEPEIRESPISSKDGRLFTPTETLENAYRDLRLALVVELLDKIKSGSSNSFEKLVLDLMEKMGYGRPEHVGRTGDEGIDGTIFEDDLGLDVIHIQAKKWDEGIVGRKEVQAFAGSLEGQRARKGVFITTSRFSQDARDYVKGIEKRIVLIDGEQLAKLMIDNDIGVKLENSYEVKKVDVDYFSQP